MGTKRVKDLIAAFVVGNGVLDLIAPRQRALLWAFGPERLRKLIGWLAEHPTARRLQGVLRVGIGLWLALRQYQRQTSSRRPWHERYRFSGDRSLSASWLAVLTLLAILLLSAFAVIYNRRRSNRGEGLAVEEQEVHEEINLPSPFKSPKGEAKFLAAYEARMRRWPVPYESMDIPGRYGRTHLVASGPKDAPPLVLLHGAIASLTMWAANIADLSRDYRVYAIDIIGEPSKSIPTQPRKTQEDCVAWLTEVLDALNIESTDMVGMSYGGWLTLNYTIGAPKRLNRIALLSPPGSFVPLAKQFLVRLLLMAYLRRRFLVESFMHWVTHEDALRDPLIRPIAFDELIDQMYLGLRYFRMPGEAPPIVFSDEELRGLQVPTLLLIGEEEVIYDPSAALERARSLIPDFEGQLIPRSKHDMAMSKHEIVDQRVLEFLKESPVHPQHVVRANGQAKKRGAKPR